MEVLKIAGQQRLAGETSLGGAKNAVLPMMAACLLIDGEIILHNVPALTDVLGMRRILELFQCSVSMEDDTLVISTEGLAQNALPDELMKSMRASNLIWGPSLGRFGKADIPLPGGCPIGIRPMDIHIKGMKALGVIVEEHHGHIISDGRSMKGSEIYLDFPSVGATENLVMAAVKIPGVTILRNVAKEPEVVDLCCFLKEAGAKISGIGTDTLRIEGVKALHSLEYTVIPDRIVGGTVLLAAALTHGDVAVTNVIPEHLEPLLAKMAEAGIPVERNGDRLRVHNVGTIGPVDLKTLPHPGFPTDIQPQFMTVLSVAPGTSVICESIFENRYQHCDELRRMGADIKVEGRTAVIQGVRHLDGARVDATDLRGGAALLMAGMAAHGETLLGNLRHIDRGYDRIEKLFCNLGADIRRILL
ncbi:MAG: UDP-N-acetylglucosamine 1-carboxyvinyltransferase [Bacillota bacterium]|nr:UDP-N-acetylglucosamine 1-carboxyvinyltransferase [Bacillota bacterium]